MQFLDEEYAHKTIYPPREDLFTCFEACSYQDVKVVMLGQDPYHRPQQAHGLCFSVRKGVKLPPSLKNMYKELKSDLDIDMPSHGYLIDWAKQGVFMMNAVLSVEEGKAGSHQKKGWEIFTDKVIETLNEHEEGIVFLLWGNWAQKKAKLITNRSIKFLCQHILPHYLHTRDFLEVNRFLKTNELLKEMGRTPIKLED